VVDLMRHPKRLLIVAGDMFLVTLANLMAVVLRFDFDWSAFWVRSYRTSELLAIDLLVTPLIFAWVGLYQGYWKYAGLDDLLRLVKAVSIRTVSVIVIFYAIGFSGLSRAVVIIDTVLLVLMAGALRLAPRFRIEIFSARQRHIGARTLIVGAGDTGESLLRELMKSPPPGYNPLAFIDDDHEKMGINIHGVPVLGSSKEMEEIIKKYAIQDVIIAIPDASSNAKQNIFEMCKRTGARFKTVPTRGELYRGAARIGQIRPVDLEDLLGREVVSLDLDILRHTLAGRRVLVTGAAGSIGRELARQIGAYNPSRLILIDRNENNLFYLESEIRGALPQVQSDVIVGDVLDDVVMRRVFKNYRPQVVFHAAAYKHVPLMEDNPLEAIKNNVLGTWRLAQIAAAEGAERFVFVSTDKAVRPASVMGATKRLGERIIKSVDSPGTACMAVRFGNVMGSDGSVIPTFRKQIASGGPITVTHPEATRFFMTIPEAVQLVLVASGMAVGGETFLLQMGEPIRIVDLARNMIELSGLRPDADIKIIFTGLRPGEKLHEELKSDVEEAMPTENEKIMVLTGIDPLGDEGWRLLDTLEGAVSGGEEERALGFLRKLVTDYTPAVARPLGREGAPDHKVVGIAGRKRLELQQ
jgi:FlaA1/EpsC-like NDP-sugar epimerase